MWLMVRHRVVVGRSELKFIEGIFFGIGEDTRVAVKVRQTVWIRNDSGYHTRLGSAMLGERSDDDDSISYAESRHDPQPVLSLI
jgi:hypothetical protein